MPTRKQVLKNSAYLLPNLMTTFNLICGLLAMVLALENYTNQVDPAKYAFSAWLLMAAVVFDFLDGKVARWTHTESQFGMKIDSFTDFISFGVAPVVVAFAAMLRHTEFWIQIISCGLFIFAGAWRLARFNCAAIEDNKPNTHFTGLPIPAASAFVCTLILVNKGPESVVPRIIGRSFSALPPEVNSLLVAMVLIALAFLMVSKIPFPAFKKVNKRNLIFLGGVLIFFSVLSVILPFENIVFLIMLLYIFIGLFQYFMVRVIQQHLKMTRED